MPEASIIIRTFNEEKHLPALLTAIRAQNYQDFEIVNVDSGSLDRTRSIAEHYCDKLVHIRSRDFTYGYSLNKGIDAASGRYIVCVSAHTKPLDEDWLERLVTPLADTSIAMVYGRQLGSSEFSRFSEIQELARKFGKNRQVLVPPNYFANNANSAIRKELWEQHPFDEQLPGLEDAEFAKYWMVRGFQTLYEPDAAIYHIHEESWRQVRRRFLGEAVAKKAMRLKGRRSIPTELLLEAWSFLGDFAIGVRQGAVPKKLSEIALYRYNKATGTTAGLWRSDPSKSPEKREAFFVDRTGKAVVIHSPGNAGLEDYPVPELKPGDVLVRIAYVGVCHTDLEVLNGTLGYYTRGLGSYPIVPGHEYSGRVAAVGSNVKDFKLGDAVVGETVQGCGDCEACLTDNYVACPSRIEIGVIGHDGAYAEYLVIPARFCHHLPETMDLREAALIEPLSVVLKGLRRTNVVSDRKLRCCVVGAGPIGHLAALVMANQGHHVMVSEPMPERRKLLDRNGIVTVNRLPQGSDVDLWVEATGKIEALQSVVEQSNAQSTILLLGLPYGSAVNLFERIVADDKSLIGSVGASGGDVDEAIKILPALDLSALIGNLLPLTNYKQAWQVAKEGTAVKTLLEVDPMLNGQLHDN